MLGCQLSCVGHASAGRAVQAVPEGGPGRRRFTRSLWGGRCESRYEGLGAAGGAFLVLLGPGGSPGVALGPRQGVRQLAP
jgi:hypothetical protein